MKILSSGFTVIIYAYAIGNTINFCYLPEIITRIVLTRMNQPEFITQNFLLK